MKKILILILIILLCVATYMLLYKNIQIGSWKTTNIEELRTLKKSLDDNINSARELSDKDYASQVDELNKSIRKLKQSKETYESKKEYLNGDTDIGFVKIKEYKIEYLWAVIQNYAIDQGILLKLDLIENSGSDSYNLDITVKGQYQGIMNFIEHIEKDDTLDFKIEEFKITPATVSTTKTTTDTSTDTEKTTQTTAVDTSTLQATFTIKNVKIGLN